MRQSTGAIFKMPPAACVSFLQPHAWDTLRAFKIYCAGRGLLWSPRRPAALSKVPWPAAVRHDITALPDECARVQDLRIQCRQRGLTPAGGREDLAERLKEHMLRTQDLCAPPPPAALRRPGRPAGR